MSLFLQGATFLASVAVALFFLSFWRRTHQPLFAVFALAFGIFAANRVALSALDDDADRLWIYVTRALVFAMIAGAVVHQNLRRRD